jgi:hypothetical protein
MRPTFPGASRSSGARAAVYQKSRCIAPSASAMTEQSM